MVRSLLAQDTPAAPSSLRDETTNWFSSFLSPTAKVMRLFDTSAQLRQLFPGQTGVAWADLSHPWSAGGPCSTRTLPKRSKPPKTPWQPRTAAVAHHWVTKTSKRRPKDLGQLLKKCCLEAAEVFFRAGPVQSDLRRSVGQGSSSLRVPTRWGRD